MRGTAELTRRLTGELSSEMQNRICLTHQGSTLDCVAKPRYHPGFWSPRRPREETSCSFHESSPNVVGRFDDSRGRLFSVWSRRRMVKFASPAKFSFVASRAIKKQHAATPIRLRRKTHRMIFLVVPFANVIFPNSINRAFVGG